MEFKEEHINHCTAYARYYAELNRPKPERIAMLAAFAVHDAIYGFNVQPDRRHESGKSYHEWLKGIIYNAIADEMGEGFYKKLLALSTESAGSNA